MVVDVSYRCELVNVSLNVMVSLSSDVLDAYEGVLQQRGWKCPTSSHSCLQHSWQRSGAEDTIASLPFSKRFEPTYEAAGRRFQARLSIAASYPCHHPPPPSRVAGLVRGKVLPPLIQSSSPWRLALMPCVRQRGAADIELNSALVAKAPG